MTLNRLSLGWKGSGPLKDELCRPIQSISAIFGHPTWRGASVITLWRPDGSGLRILNRMHDILPRLEVGVLTFEPASCSTLGEQTLDLKGRFDCELKAWKLVVVECETIAESGIVLEGRDEIEIAAGAFPLTLAVRGVEFESPASEPEYPWHDYQRSDF